MNKIPVPTDYQQQQAEIAVKMLLYCSIFYYLLTHLNEELHKEGKLKGHIKHTMKNWMMKAERVSTFTEERVYGAFDNKLADHYLERAYEVFEDIATKSNSFGKSKMRQIKEGIKPLQPLEKYYQLCCALSTLIESMNTSLADSFYYEKAEKLYGFEKYFKLLNLPSNPKLLDLVSNIPTGVRTKQNHK